MNFKSFLDKLNVVDTHEMEDIHFNVVDQFTEDMFAEDMALYVEMLGENYHLEDIVGVAWGSKKQIYVTSNEEIFENPFSKNGYWQKIKRKSMMQNGRMWH